MDYSWDYRCGYNPPPPNFNNWMPPLYADRLKRLKNGTLPLELKMNKRTMIIALHLFADEVDGLKPWLDMLYEVAAPSAFGKEIEFLVDDLWAAYIFDPDEFSFFRGDSNFSTQMPPLIFGVSAAGELHFLGNASGPCSISLTSLKEFCGQLLAGTLVQQFKFEELIRVPDVDLARINELIYGEEQADIILGFYNSQEHGKGKTDKFLQDLSQLAGRLKHENIKIFKMNIWPKGLPKKFDVQSTPAMFLIPQAQKHNPIRCYDPSRGIVAMFKHVAQHASEELNFYDRRGIRKCHAQFIIKLQAYFKRTEIPNFW